MAQEGDALACVELSGAPGYETPDSGDMHYMRKPRFGPAILIYTFGPDRALITLLGYDLKIVAGRSFLRTIDLDQQSLFLVMHFSL